MSKWLSAGMAALGLMAVAQRSGAVPSRMGTRAPTPFAAQVSQQCRIDLKGDKKDEWVRLPTAEASVTQHRFSAGGKSFDYTATAGTLIIRDDDDKPTASVGYVAYTP